MLMQVGHLKDRLEEHLKFRESSSTTDLSAAASDGGLVAITRAIRAVANDAESCTRCSSAAVAERLLEAAANLHTVSSAAVASGMTPRSARSELDLLRCESEENINGGGSRIHSTVVYGGLLPFILFHPKIQSIFPLSFCRAAIEQSEYGQRRRSYLQRPFPLGECQRQREVRGVQD